MWKHTGYCLITITHSELVILGDSILSPVLVCMWRKMPCLCDTEAQAWESVDSLSHFLFLMKKKNGPRSLVARLKGGSAKLFARLNALWQLADLNKSTQFQVTQSFSNIFSLLCQLIILNIVGGQNYLAESRNSEVLGGLRSSDMDIKLIRGGRHTKQSAAFLKTQLSRRA